MSTALTLIDLRSGGANDLSAIEGIMRRAFDPRFGEAWTRGQCLGILAMPGVWLKLAEVNGEAAGFALARAGGGEAELMLLASEPRFRRQGVGRALLRSIIADARARGATQVFLEVRAGNDAIAFYEQLGFGKVGERRAYYRGTGGQLYDAYTYRLALD